MLASEIIRRVREIQVRTGRQVADVLAGEYVSVFKGAGIEFDQVRPYLVGDDVRTIDWNVTARAGAPFVKRYVEERQLTLMIMADVSASQDFGSGDRSKREATAELCALLAFTAIRSDDKVGLVLFHGDVEQYIPPRKGQKHALRVVREVLAHGDTPESVTATGKRKGWRAWLRPRRRPRTPREDTSITRALEFLLSVSKRKTICFIVSDFLDEDFEHAMSMANRRHDIIAVLVSDPRELEIPGVGLVGLTDAETGKAALYDTGSVRFRERLAALAEERVSSLERRLRRRNIDFIHVNAAADVVEPLVAFFRMREKRSRR